MKFGYTIVYVSDVSATLDFFGRAFGLSTRFLHETGDYGELETGNTTLAFASFALAEGNFPGGCLQANPQDPPFPMELAFVTDDVPAAVAKAVAAGAVIAADAKTKPWGQVVAYVRTPDGTLVELCSPMGG